MTVVHPQLAADICHMLGIPPLQGIVSETVDVGQPLTHVSSLDVSQPTLAMLSPVYAATSVLHMSHTSQKLCLPMLEVLYTRRLLLYFAHSTGHMSQVKEADIMMPTQELSSLHEPTSEQDPLAV